MTTLTRKQREVRTREETLLDISRRLLLENGYAGLTMDQLADASEYSKGVVYQHFKSKEDVVTALAVQTLRDRVSRFERAMTFQGRPRERMLAIGVAEELFVRLHPQHFHTEQIIKMASLHERASSDRVEELRREEGGCFTRVLSIVMEAIAAKDLELKPQQQPAEIVLSLWAMNQGYHSILGMSTEIFSQHGITTPFATLRQSCESFLDGIQWRPLSTEWDYDATYHRILREIFPEECVKAGIG